LQVVENYDIGWPAVYKTAFVKKEKKLHTYKKKQISLGSNNIKQLKSNLIFVICSKEKEF
jgi:hypothetical protein